MKNIVDLTAAINTRLTDGFAALTAANPETRLAGMSRVAIMTEDAQDLDTKINKALNELGMVVVIGQPVLENTTPLSQRANFKVHVSLAVGENPLLWRGALKPVCLDVVQSVVQLLQGYPVAGFQPLRVQRADFIPDKKRQLYELPIESMLMFNPLD
jgi:hypothetical protein